tara:strand:+ start:1943 stop:2311 length:369 start_codon:yes stop_codon:yes gene_type:complete
MYIENGKFILEDITIDQMFILDDICIEMYKKPECNNSKMLAVCQEYLEAIEDIDELTQHAWYLSLRNLLLEKVKFDVNADHVVYFADSFIILHDDLLQKDIEKRKKRQRARREKAKLKSASI